MPAIKEIEKDEQLERNKALDAVKDPQLKKTFSRLWETLDKSNLCKEVEEFKKEINKIPQKPEQQIFAFLPHQMAKTSIFFPLSDRELKSERRKINKIEHETGWGKIVIEGIKLAIFEEDILLSLLCLAKDNYKKFENKFMIETNLNKIINILYGRKGYSKRNENIILRSLKNFELVSFDLIVGEWKKRGKERLKTERIRSVGNIIAGYDYDIKTKDIKIFFNPHFFSYFLESMLTNINLSLRRKLKRDGSKALLRFLSAHNEPSQMHIETVLKAINYNTEQPMYALRRKFKQFITELKNHKVLGNKTKLHNDIIYFDILKPEKSLPV